MSAPAQIERGPISEESKYLLEECAIREYNDIAMHYGAEITPLPSAQHQIATHYKLLRVSDLCKASPFQWRIKGVIPESGIAAVFGPSGSAKSFLVLDMAFSIAKGAPWFGYRTTPCPVVYVCLEGEGGLSKRILAYSRKAVTDPNVRFVMQTCDLFNPEDVKNLIKAIQMHRAADGIVILDTLNRAAPGMDENSSADMGRVIHAAKWIQQELDGLVIFVHHTGKDATKGMRGHSSLFAALDAAVEVKRTGDRREWSIAKAKDGEDGKAHTFRLERVDLGIDADGDPINSCVIQPTFDGATPSKPLTATQQIGMDSFHAAAAKILDEENPTVHASLGQWREEFYRISTADSLEAKQKAFQRVRSDLIKLGRLVVQNDIYSLPAMLNFPSGQRTSGGHVRSDDRTDTDTTL